MGKNSSTQADHVLNLIFIFGANLNVIILIKH